MKVFCCLFLLFVVQSSNAQLTPFEKSGGNETATYLEAINWYQVFNKQSSYVSLKTMGPTDAGYPLHLAMISSDGKFDPKKWHQQGKIVILINNGIHPGEPDGIDASMMLVRDIILKKVFLPSNVVLAVIPIYNIGGALNRNAYTRANQNGPVEYGFRGNSQNLDLNRDFTKADTKEARSFTEIFHYLNPDILIDNHVSDGADFQHTMTLISTQYDKLGLTLGKFLKEKFEPKLYSGMKSKGWDMIPYVDFETTDFDSGMKMFMDPPRYSTGYAALFNTLAFMPETHMLKPFKQRVSSTYDLMKTFIEESSSSAKAIKTQRKIAAEEWKNKISYPIRWKSDTASNDTILFKGYNKKYKESKATGLQKMYYDHDDSFEKKVKFFNKFLPDVIVIKPKAYIIPQGWYEAINLLKLNKVVMSQLKKDTTISVKAYRIKEYKSNARAYEKHHKNYGVIVSDSIILCKFQKGDYVINMNQPADRYIIEMLEPTGDDSFFSWNFFDGILQQKEGYSDYRWDDIAAQTLKQDEVLQKALSLKKSTDVKFANDAGSILDFIYKNSAFYEKAHMQYPIYRIEL